MIGKKTNPQGYNQSQQRSREIKLSKGRAEQQSSRVAPSRYPSLQVRQSFVHHSIVDRWQNEMGQEQGHTVKYNRARKQTIPRQAFYESEGQRSEYSEHTRRVVTAACLMETSLESAQTPVPSQDTWEPGRTTERAGSSPSLLEVKVCFQRIKRAEAKRDSLSGGIFKSHKDTVS